MSTSQISHQNAHWLCINYYFYTYLTVCNQNYYIRDPPILFHVALWIQAECQYLLHLVDFDHSTHLYSTKKSSIKTKSGSFPIRTLKLPIKQTLSEVLEISYISRSISKKHSWDEYLVYSGGTYMTPNKVSG